VTATPSQRQNDDAAGAHPSSDAPLLRVVRGNPTPEELAALVAVVATRGTAEPEPAPVRSLWARPILRTSLPSSWRASSFPR
jgi:hypothetical protein